MKYEFEGKLLNIPDKEIEKSMSILDLTKDEAIQLWLEDNGHCVNEEQEKLNETAKSVKVSSIVQAQSAKPRKSYTKTKKEDATKINLISQLKEFLSTLEDVSDVEITNESKLVTFRLGDENFKLDLIRTRKAKS